MSCAAGKVLMSVSGWWSGNNDAIPVSAVVNTSTQGRVAGYNSSAFDLSLNIRIVCVNAAP